MGKAEIGTTKYQAKRLKAAGLQKLRFYCQICEKQCRDSNGFKNHLSSFKHQNKVKEISSTGKGRSVIETYSEDFKNDFLRLLRVNHGTKKINANKFYQEYILHDRDHIHMNSTKWPSLTSFVKFLGNRGLVKVYTSEDESEFNIEISLVDDSSEYHLQKNKVQEKEKAKKTDNDISSAIINKQISKGKEYLTRFASNKDNNVEPKSAQSPAETQGKIRVGITKNTSKKKIKNVFGSDDDSDE